MPLLSIQTDIDEAVKFLSALPATVEGAIDTNEILDAAGAVLLNRMRQRFLAKTDPDMIPWIPSKAGLKRMAKGGPGTLFNTGKLFHSIQLHKVGDTERAISTDIPYAPYHQNGTGKLPMRMFLGFSLEDQNVYESVVHNMLARQLKDKFKENP